MKAILKLLALVVTLQCFESKTLTVDKLELDVDPAYVRAKSKLRSEDGTNMIDIDLEIIKESPELQYQAVIYRLNEDHFELFYKSDLESSCSHEAINDPILKFMFKESQKYGNITEACPSKVGHYQIRNFRIDPADIPQQIAPGSYRFDFTAYVKVDGKQHDIYTDKYYFTSS